jgi:hypothetical protein
MRLPPLGWADFGVLTLSLGVFKASLEPVLDIVVGIRKSLLIMLWATIPKRFLSILILI